MHLKSIFSHFAQSQVGSNPIVQTAEIQASVNVKSLIKMKGTRMKQNILFYAFLILQVSASFTVSWTGRFGKRYLLKNS